MDGIPPRNQSNGKSKRCGTKGKNIWIRGLWRSPRQPFSMKTDPANPETAGAAKPPPSPRLAQRKRRLLYAAGGVILVYLAVAYVIMPSAWKRDVRRHPELFDAPRITHTPAGIPGDPVNVVLLGSESDVIRAMTTAKWDPADEL